MTAVLVLFGCGGAEGRFTPPPIACPDGAEPELFRFSETRVESRRDLSDVGWRCMRTDGVRHGPSREWFADGQPSVVTEWQAGEKHGPFTMWHPNGQKRAEGEHRRWAPVGTWTTWDEEGNVLSTREFGYPEPEEEAVSPDSAEPEGGAEEISSSEPGDT